MRRKLSGPLPPSVVLPAILAPVLEASLGLALGIPSAAVLAPQASAPPPFDLFHDLRWVAVYHDSWWALGAELIAVVAVRAVWVAWVVARSWPVRPPGMGPAVGRAVVVHAVVVALLAPWVALLFALAVTHISFLFLAAIPPVLALSLAIHGGGVGAALGRWRWGPRGSGLAWTAAAFAWLTAAGAINGRAPAPVMVLASGAAGVLNARAWVSIARGLAAGDPGPRPWVAPVAAALTFVIAVGGSAVGLAAVDATGRGPSPPSPRIGGTSPVLVAGGLLGRLRTIDPVDLPRGYVAWPFSYRGIDVSGRPLPYGPRDTLRPISVSAVAMARQVAELWHAYRRPVTIVAESEGALVARTYLVELYPEGSGIVDRLIALSPNAGPARVFFPTRTEEGWGVGSGWALRILSRFIGALLAPGISPDAPIARELTDCRARFERVLRSPLPEEVEEVTVGALADLVDPVEATDVVVTATHGGLLHRPTVRELVRALLEGQTIPDEGSPLAEAVAASAAAWRVPDLAPSLSPDRCPPSP